MHSIRLGRQVLLSLSVVLSTTALLPLWPVSTWLLISVSQLKNRNEARFASKSRNAAFAGAARSSVQRWSASSAFGGVKDAFEDA